MLTFISSIYYFTLDRSKGGSDNFNIAKIETYDVSTEYLI